MSLSEYKIIQLHTELTILRNISFVVVFFGLVFLFDCFVGRVFCLFVCCFVVFAATVVVVNIKSSIEHNCKQQTK